MTLMLLFLLGSTPEPPRPVYAAPHARLPSHVELRCGPVRVTAVPHPAEPAADVILLVQASRLFHQRSSEVAAAAANWLAHARPGDRIRLLSNGDSNAALEGSGPILAALGSIPERPARPLSEALNAARETLHDSVNPAIVLLAAAEEPGRAELPALPFPVFVVSLIPRHDGDSIPFWYQLSKLADRTAGDLLEPFDLPALPKALGGIEYHPAFLVDVPAGCPEPSLHASRSLHLRMASTPARP